MPFDKFITVIPARYASSRLPGKPLAMIGDKPMIQHVYERACQSEWFSQVLIATDSEEVRSVCDDLRMNVVMTSRSHQSGTDRIHEVNSRIKADIVVNLQGDEPMLDILDIRRNQVLMESEFPSELANAFNGMERQGNPWQDGRERMLWAEDLDIPVPTIDENPDFEMASCLTSIK